MAVRREFNREAKQVKMYFSNEVADVSFYNQGLSDGGPSAKILAIIGKAVDLERVGHYGFRRFKHPFFFSADIECWAKDEKHAVQAFALHFDEVPDFTVKELIDDNLYLSAA